MYSISRKKSSNLSSAERQEIIHFLVEQFPENPNYRDVVYTNPDLETSILIHKNGCLVGHAGITKRNTNCGGKNYLIGGVGDVAIEQVERNRGLGSRLLYEVANCLDEENYDLGLLFCHPSLDSFYTKNGWIKKTNGTIFATIDDKTTDQQLSYFLPLRLNSRDINIWNTENVNIGIGSW